MMFHPRFSQLNRFSDGDLSPGARARVANHLAACTKCRRVVQSIREIADQAPTVLLEQPAPDLLDKILERRARGDRVILPLSDPRPARRTDWRAMGAAAAIVVALVAAGVVLVHPGTLRADDSELVFAPEDPERGAVISVAYKPSGLLADNERLVLRARFRRPHDRPYRYTARQVTAAVLDKGQDGLFHGSFQLPDSTVYAAFAVEDPNGEVVDCNGEALWELLTFEGEKPSYSSLHQRYADLSGRNWTEEVRNAEVMTELYPDRLDSWAMLSAFQRSVPGRDGRDSVMAVIAARADSLHNLFATDSLLSADDLATMYWIVLTDSRDSAVVQFWWDRLAREAPLHRTLAQHLASHANREISDDLQARLLRLEEIWNEYGPVHHHVSEVGFQTASLLGDVRTMSLWAPRLESQEPWFLQWTAREFLRFPELREAGMAKFRELLSRLDAETDPDRYLIETVDLMRVRHDRTRRSYLARLGKALVDAGNLEAGIDTLELAVATGWDVEVFRSAADARLALGDSSRAIQMLSWIAADPTTDSITYAHVSEEALQTVDSVSWERFKTEGRTEMWRRVLADAAPFASSLTNPVIADRDGTHTSLREIANGRPLLVVLSAFMSGSLGERALRHADSTRHRWQDMDADVLIVTKETLDDRVRALIEAQHPDVSLFHDVLGEVTRNLDWWITPNYVVIDSDFRLRFKGDFGAAVRVLEALLARSDDIESGSVVVAPS